MTSLGEVDMGSILQDRIVMIRKENHKANIIIAFLKRQYENIIMKETSLYLNRRRAGKEGKRQYRLKEFMGKRKERDSDSV